MALALAGTFLLPGMRHFVWVVVAIVIGTVPGWLLAKRVKMTAMPQMVSLFNGMGGACALFISLGEWVREPGTAQSVNGEVLARAFPMLLGIVFGAVSFSGSLIAFGKLQGLISEKPLRWPLQRTINVRPNFDNTFDIDVNAVVVPEDKKKQQSNPGQQPAQNQGPRNRPGTSRPPRF